MWRRVELPCPLWVSLSPNLHFSQFWKISKPHPVGFLWSFITQKWLIKWLAIGDRFNLQLFSLPWGQRWGSCNQPSPSGVLPVPSWTEQKSPSWPLSHRKFQGFWEFCARNRDKDQIHISYYKLHCLSELSSKLILLVGKDQFLVGVGLRGTSVGWLPAGLALHS